MLRLLAVFLLTSCATASLRPSASPIAGNAPPGTVPAGTLVSGQINQPLSTATSKPGDRFTVELLDPLVDSHGDELAPRGAIVDGTVSGSKRAFGAGEAAIDLQLTGIEQAGDSSIPASIEVAQSPVELSSIATREVVGGIAGIAVGTGAGLAIEHTQAGVVVGSAFLGLALGVVAGYLFGTRDAVLPVGSVITLRFTHDLALAHPIATKPVHLNQPVASEGPPADSKKGLVASDPPASATKPASLQP